MYDLEVSHPKHNYLLPNGVVTSNSHSVCYSVLAYACAYLKHHYSLEWWCAVLRNAKKDEIASVFWAHCGHLIDFPDIKLSGVNFEIQNGRIRAPLGFLSGVGPGAQEELTAGMPYASIEDLCQKREAHKVRKTALHTNKNGVTGSRKGTSALNNGVLSKLIVGGAMDGLFGPDMSTLDKLQAYCKASAEAGKKKRPDAILPLYLEMTPLRQYQLRKQILPIYSAPLGELIWRSNAKEVSNKIEDNGRHVYRFKHDGEQINLVNGKEMRFIEDARKGDNLPFALPAYVQAERSFTYKDGTARAVQYTLEVEGELLEFVSWPSRKNSDIKTPEGIVGAIVVAVVNRWSPNRPAAIRYIEVVEPPITDSKEESKEESK